MNILLTVKFWISRPDLMATFTGVPAEHEERLRLRLIRWFHGLEGVQAVTVETLEGSPQLTIRTPTRAEKS